MADVYFLLETDEGTVEVLPCSTRISAVVALHHAMDERPDARRLTVSEETRPVYSMRKTPAGWREDPIE